MSLLYAYRESMEISNKGYSFHGLIMAAMRVADTQNTEHLRRAFPTIWHELDRRYNSAGGRLPEDDDAQPDRRASRTDSDGTQAERELLEALSPPVSDQDPED